MNEKEEEYYDEHIFNNLVDTTTKVDSSQSPITDLEYQYSMTVPEAKNIFADINKDMLLSNLDSNELMVVRLKSSLIKDLEYIKKHNGLGNDELINMFRHDRDVILASSLSKEGFLRDNLISQIRKFALDRKKQENKGKLKLRWGSKDE